LSVSLLYAFTFSPEDGVPRTFFAFVHTTALPKEEKKYAKLMMILQVRHILHKEILEYQNQCNFDQHTRNILYETNGKQKLPCLNKHFDIFPQISIVSEKQQYNSHLLNFPFLHDAVQY
ncbi:hypothetical protein T02_9668, partial [Trichinella nativa]